MLRLSVTDLETWRYHKESETATLEDLVNQLLHREPPTPRMEAGKAFAKLFEHARHGILHDEEVDGWKFYFDLDAEIALPSVRELKAEVVFETPSGPVTLVGKTDCFDGAVHDQKLSDNFDAERYLDSLQWRSYLDMFRAKKFIYDVFVGKRDEEAKEVRIVDYHPLPFYAYPGIRDDVQRAVNELADVYVRYVLPRIQAAPKAAAGGR
jgi:hypothetical protein